MVWLNLLNNSECRISLEEQGSISQLVSTKIDAINIKCNTLSVSSMVPMLAFYASNHGLLKIRPDLSLLQAVLRYDGQQVRGCELSLQLQGKERRSSKRNM